MDVVPLRKTRFIASELALNQMMYGIDELRLSFLNKSSRDRRIDT